MKSYIEYSTSVLRGIIAEWIHNERDRKIIERRLIDGITFERLAEEFDMSVRQIKNIVYKSQEQLSRHL